MTSPRPGSTQFSAPAFEPVDLDEAVGGLLQRWSRGTPTMIVDRSHPTALMTPALEPISLRRLCRIVRLDVPNAAVIAEAGVPVHQIRDVVASDGLWCPALRWLPDDETIGAAVAGGHGRRTRRYGSTIDYLLGTRFVCPSVGLSRHGGLAIKNATGYNLSSAVAGSRGRLAVILEVILRLVPLPRHRSVLVFSGATETSGLDAARALACPTLTDGAKAIVDRSVAAVEVWASARSAGSFTAVEIDAGDGQIRDDVVGSVERHLTERGCVAVSSSVWPPLLPQMALETRRRAVDPADIGETLVRFRGWARDHSPSALLLAEFTGGALEMSVGDSLPWPDGFDQPSVALEPSEGAGRLRSALKAAFDPVGLLHVASGRGDSYAQTP